MVKESKHLQTRVIFFFASKEVYYSWYRYIPTCSSL